jgi:hypothetical protein
MADDVWYAVELLGYEDGAYVFAELMGDFGLDFDGAMAYAEDLARNRTDEALEELRRRSMKPFPFLVDVNLVIGSYGTPMLGYEHNGFSVEKIAL